ncbi:TPR-like protein [Penicillium herquei]|nr:TPR-like protein [Penicillium herquei]
MLPSVLPRSRIIVYNYHSRWHADAPKTRLQACGEELVHSIHQFRKGTDSQRPIIFVGHSLGGNVIQSALLFADKSDDYDYLPKITVGLIFLGSPFRGSKMQVYASIAAWSMTAADSHGEILQDMTYHNSVLRDRLQCFCKIREKLAIPTSCFYELFKTDYGHKVGIRGYFKGMCDHFALNKFESPTDRSFLLVKGEMTKMVRNSKELIQQRNSGLSEYQWMVPFGRNRDFTGRESIVDQLCKQIDPTADAETCQRTAVLGLGGTGKTQVALELAYRLRARCSVFWVPAVDVGSFEKAYREIGRRLKVDGIEKSQNDVKALVKRALSQEEAGKWLLIIDNADDPKLFGKASISNYLPFSLKGSILLTTRNQQVVQQSDISSKNTVSLSGMTRAESTQLLEKLIGSQDSDHASMDRLLDFLVDLPLAIKQAAAYLVQTQIPVPDYLQFYQSNKTQARLMSCDFEDQYRYEQVGNAVSTTWLISFKNIQRDNLLAADYLRSLCLLGEKEIPLTLIPHDEDELDVLEAIGLLRAYKLITSHKDVPVYDVHRLVRLAMRAWMRHENSLQGYATEVLQWVNYEFPRPRHRNQAMWMSYLPHAESIVSTTRSDVDLPDEPDLLLNMGRAYLKLGKYNDAEVFCRRGVQAREKVPGHGHQDTLADINTLGIVLGSNGKFEEAEAMHRRALQAKEKFLGPEHPRTLTSMNNLGVVLQQQGKFEEAEAMYRHAIQAKEKLLGPENSHTLTSIDNLGIVLQSQDKFKEAEAIHQRVLQAREKTLGPEHPETLFSINNLAICFEREGKFKEAEAMHRHAIQVEEKASGPEHPETLTSINNLAICFEREGKFKEAEAMHQRVLQAREKKLGPEHPETLISINNLAICFEREGKFKEAEAMHQRVLQAREKTLGPEHPETLTSINNLASTLEKQGKFKEAEKMYRHAIQARVKILGPEHPSTLDSIDNLASLLEGLEV